jgi:hypothetical protein
MVSNPLKLERKKKYLQLKQGEHVNKTRNRNKLFVEECYSF